jgi:predicted acetyltransferase
MAITVRPLGVDDTSWQRLSRVDALAFYGDEREPAPQHDTGVLDFERALVAYDGDEPVGCAASFGLDVSVPGGSLPTAGVTWVGVAPTARRQGAMTGLMRTLHDQVLESGREPLLALWASQGALYQRFGYGVASISYVATVPHHLRLAHAPGRRLEVRHVETASDREPTRRVYEAVRTTRPGMPAVDDAWHERNVADPKDARDGASGLRTLVVFDGADPQGYARLRYQHDWSQGFGDGTVRVVEMVCATPAAAATLYDLLLGSDMMRRTRLWNLPEDDPILTWPDDPKQLDLRRRDQLYVRLTSVDVLEQRSFSAPVDVVIDVRDPFHPANEGAWALQADTDGASCVRTSRSADVSVDVSVLGATFLGSVGWGRLALAGQVQEHRAGAVAALDAAFRWPTAAWCPFVF